MAALLFCTPSIGSVDLAVINGHTVVQDGQLLTLSLQVGFHGFWCRQAEVLAELYLLKSAANPLYSGSQTAHAIISAPYAHTWRIWLRAMASSIEAMQSRVKDSAWILQAIAMGHFAELYFHCRA